MIHSCDLCDVVDMIDQRLQWWTRNLGRPFPLDAIYLDVGNWLSRCFGLGKKCCYGSITVFLLSLGRLTVVFVDEGIIEICLHYAAILRDGAQHFVGHVASMISQSARR